MTKTSSSQNLSLGQQLVALLSTDQVAELFDLLLEDNQSSESQKLKQQLQKQLEKCQEGKGTLNQMTELEEWKNLKEEYQHLLQELGKEQGAYVYQEEYWEPPTFDNHRVSKDLDKISIRRFHLLDYVFQNNLESHNFFQTELQEIEERIQNYPEWMGASYSDCSLELATVQSILYWESLVTDSVEEFVEKIHQMLDELKILRFETEVVLNYFEAMEGEKQKLVYQYLSQNHNDSIWKAEFGARQSVWQQVYHSFSRSFDPEAYLENCYRFLSQDWRYGLPLLKEKKKTINQEELEQVMQKTVSSFLHFEGENDNDDEDWYPEKELIIIHERGMFPNEEILKLIEDWSNLAHKQKNWERLAALKLQKITYDRRNQWDEVILVYEEVFSSAQKTSSKLLEQWQNTVLFQNASYSDDQSILQNCWIRWLLETRTDSRKTPIWFFKEVKQWLSQIKSQKQLHKNLELIYTLTADLIEIYELNDQYLNFYEVLRYNRIQSSVESRRAWLKKIHMRQLIPVLFTFWKKKVINLIPDPNKSIKSEYEEHAKWLSIAHELNLKVYKETLLEWKNKHAKKKNLWKELSKRRIV